MANTEQQQGCARVQPDCQRLSFEQTQDKITGQTPQKECGAGSPPVMKLEIRSKGES